MSSARTRTSTGGGTFDSSSVITSRAGGIGPVLRQPPFADPTKIGLSTHGPAAQQRNETESQNTHGSENQHVIKRTAQRVALSVPFCTDVRPGIAHHEL